MIICYDVSLSMRSRALGEPRNSTLKHFSLHVYHAPLLLITASYNIYFCIYRKRAMDRSSNNFKIVPLTTYFFILQANNIKVQRRLKNFPLETSRPFWQISQSSTLWRFQCFRSMASSRFHFHSTLLEKEMDNEGTIIFWSDLAVPSHWSLRPSGREGVQIEAHQSLQQDRRQIN